MNSKYTLKYPVSIQSFLIRAHAKQIINERELDILKRRNGLDRDHSETLKSIGDDLGVSKERIRVLEKRAMEKLGLTKEDFNKSTIVPIIELDLG